MNNSSSHMVLWSGLQELKDVRICLWEIQFSFKRLIIFMILKSINTLLWFLIWMLWVTWNIKITNNNCLGRAGESTTFHTTIRKRQTWLWSYKWEGRSWNSDSLAGLIISSLPHWPGCLRLTQGSICGYQCAPVAQGHTICHSVLAKPYFCYIIQS